MKFTLIKDIKKDRLMQPILSGLLFFILLYLCGDFLIKQESIGLTYNAIFSTFHGDEELFLDPLSKSSFLELWHMEIFFIMMVVFTLSAITVRVAEGMRNAIIGVNIMLVSSFISLLALACAYFIADLFLWIYLVTFFLWHALALFFVSYCLKRFLFA